MHDEEQTTFSKTRSQQPDRNKPFRRRRPTSLLQLPERQLFIRQELRLLATSVLRISQKRTVSRRPHQQRWPNTESHTSAKARQEGFEHGHGTQSKMEGSNIEPMLRETLSAQMQLYPESHSIGQPPTWWSLFFSTNRTLVATLCKHVYGTEDCPLLQISVSSAETGPSAQRTWHDTSMETPQRALHNQKGARNDVHSTNFFNQKLLANKRSGEYINGKRSQSRRIGCTLSTVVLLYVWWETVLLMRNREKTSRTHNTTWTFTPRALSSFRQSGEGLHPRARHPIVREIGGRLSFGTVFGTIMRWVGLLLLEAPMRKSPIHNR